MSSTSSPTAPRFRLDLSSYQLLDAGHTVRLERQPMELLILLAERKGQLVTREEIAARLWGEGVFVDTDRNINSIIRKLRHALKDDPEKPAFVETVIGKGYRFVGPLEITAAERKTITAAETPGQVRGQAGLDRRRKLWLLLATCGALAVAGWFALKALRPGGDAPTARSIAILPLDDLGGDATQEYFADGLTQELTTELAQASELRVISHTSVLPYKQGHKPAADVAKDLHVDALIEGSVLRSGSRIRVSVRLVRLPSEHAIWANTYERNLQDVLELQRDLAQDIAEQVKIKLVRSGTQSGATLQLDPVAHDAYLQGLFHYEKQTESDLQQAIADFQKALGLSPTYAAAYAGMADSYVALGVLYRPTLETMPQAKAAALKALELDPDLSQAHAALAAVYYYYQWDWAAAEREIKRAIELNPSDAGAHDLLAAYYGTVGRFEDSRVELQRARELAPGSAVILGDSIFWSFFSRNYQATVANGEAVLALQPDNAFAQVFLGMAYAEQGKVADALRHADLAVSYDQGPLVASFRANVYAIAGRRTEALAALRAVEKQRVEHYSCAYEIGTAYILLHDVDRGFQWLNNAYNGRSECLILLKVDPRLDSVRSDARFARLLRDVGLTD